MIKNSSFNSIDSSSYSDTDSYQNFSDDEFGRPQSPETDISSLKKKQEYHNNLRKLVVEQLKQFGQTFLSDKKEVSFKQCITNLNKDFDKSLLVQTIHINDADYFRGYVNEHHFGTPQSPTK